MMDFYIGERVICSESGVIGDIIKFYRPTASEEQIMVRTIDGRNYHAPTRTWKPYQLTAKASQSCSESAAAPLLRETMKIHIDGKAISVYKDDVEKELYKHLGVGLMSFGG